MKRNKSFIFLLAGLLCVAVVVLLAVPMLTVQSASRNIVGAWNTSMTTESTGDAVFPKLINFFSDGNLIADEVPIPLETSGHGSWTRTSANDGEYHFYAFVGDADPNLWSILKVSGKFHYSAKTDEWSGPWTIIITDQSGGVVYTDKGTMSGKRIAP